MLQLQRERSAAVMNGFDLRFGEPQIESSFRDAVGIKGPFILNVGNIEPRKNQLALVQALAGRSLPLVLIGRQRDATYAAEVLTEGGAQVRYVGALDHADPLLASAFKTCSAFVLPSTLETPGFAALEAAASGVPVVVTSEGFAREYFGAHVHYVNHRDPADIWRGIAMALAARTQCGPEGARHYPVWLARGHRETRGDLFALQSSAGSLISGKAGCTAVRKPDIPLPAIGRPSTAYMHYREILNGIRGLAGSLIVFPVAERIERRDMRGKQRLVAEAMARPFADRRLKAWDSIVETVEFAAAKVPYYRDLFVRTGFDPGKLRRDPRFFRDIPLLTKDIIRAEGDRLLRDDHALYRKHVAKTGGSTGPSAHIYYDQDAADSSSAVTRYARKIIGAGPLRPELHFASKFPDAFPWKARMREHAKCLSNNRYNVFFASFEPFELEEIWRQIKSIRPYLVHGHPSTLYQLALYVEAKYGGGQVFNIFKIFRRTFASQTATGNCPRIWMQGRRPLRPGRDWCGCLRDRPGANLNAVF